jgi:hypothetical protein
MDKNEKTEKGVGVAPEKKPLSRAALEALCEQIARLEKNHHIEILQILRKYPAVPLVPKSNGFHLCADLFPVGAVEEIQKYVQYVREQETTLQEIESQKKEIRRDYFVE